MEEWQISYITSNLPELIRMTSSNTQVLSILKAERILSNADLCSLEATKIAKGCDGQSAHLYDLLPGRKFAYEKLTKALFENNQSGAARILLEGLRKQGIRDSLSHCGIKIEHHNFENADILAYGRRFKLKQFFPNTNTSTLRKIFYKLLPDHIYYENLVDKNGFEIVNNTIPPKPTFYIPRYLSNRIKVNSDLFQHSCKDVFVFKGIERYNLSKLAKPNYTASSKTQLESLTSRFIHLDRDEDWAAILKLAKVPVHLISYESTENSYVLENSSGNSEILSNFCSIQDRAYISEEEFITRILEEKNKVSGVCICDTPGMGKTLLLANIARRLVEDFPTAATVFLSLSNLLESISNPLPGFGEIPVDALLYVLQYTTPTKETALVLVKLVEQNFIKMYLLFDGFDEISSQEVEWTNKLFNVIVSAYPGIKIFVTSRPHMRHDLQTSLKVVAYDILPFDRDNQVDFLVQFWSNEYPSCKASALEKYALSVLEVVKETLSEDEKDIAGIPLLCGLIASVYGNEAVLFSSSDEVRCPRTRTIYEMYQKFIDTKFEAMNERICPPDTFEAQDVKRIHSWHAWRLLFPGTDFVKTPDKFNNFFDLGVIFKAGIMHQRSNGKTIQPEFVHRTFAEYLVAEDLSQYLLYLNTSNNEPDNRFEFVLTKVLKCRQQYKFLFYDNSSFFNSVIVYFMNSLLNPKVGLSITVDQIESFCTSIPPTATFVVLRGSLEKSYGNIFLLFEKHSV